MVELKESLVKLNHLQQIVTFARGGGVEFLPLVDDELKSRQSFVNGLISANELEARLDEMLVKLMESGRLLLYLRPVDSTYEIQEFDRENYRCLYRYGRKLDAVRLCWSYKQANNGVLAEKWIELRITEQSIDTKTHDTKPDLDQPFQPVGESQPNTLGFIPAIECLNVSPASKRRGESDFEELKEHLYTHDEIVSSIIDNLDFYCHSPLITSRDAADIKEAMHNNEGSHNSVSYASGFRSVDSRWSLRKKRREKIAKIIGNVESDERFEQLNINPIPPDFLLFSEQYERQLRESLGGILERGIETATETRTVYGKVMATASQKQKSLYTYGLCKILEMAIFAEEAIYAATEGRFGLPLLGNRALTWRLTPVYQESTNEINLRSITARNLMKFNGISARESLKYVFPNKSEAELDAMVGNGGFPSDYMQTAIAMYSSLAGTLDPLTQLPVADASGVPLCNLLLPFIVSNLQYGTQFDSSGQSSPDPADFYAALAAAVERVTQQQQQQLVQNNDRQSFGSPDQLPAAGSTVTNSPTFADRYFPTFKRWGSSLANRFTGSR